MDFASALKDWWPLIILIFNGLAIWIAWSFRRSTVSPDDFKQLTSDITDAITALDKDVKRQLGEHEKRILTVEGEVKGLPKHDDLKDIHARLGGVSRQLSEVVGSTSAMANQTATIYQYLLTLNNAGKGQ